MALFVELEAQVDRIAGFHTGSTQHIDSNFLNSAAVFQHESVHDEIFSETPDGILHALLLRKQRVTEDADERKALEQATRRLFAETRFAHEVGATYIGLCLLATEAEKADTFSQLNAEYRGYQSLLDDILAPAFTSVLVRCAIAGAINRWAFSSPRIMQLTSVADLCSAKFWDIAGPDQRLNALVAAIRSIGSGGFRARFMHEMALLARSQQPDIREIDDEETWSTKPLHDQRELDSLSVRVAEKLIPTLCTLPHVLEFPVPEFLSTGGHRVDVRWYQSAAMEQSQISRDVAYHLARRASTRRIHRSSLPQTVYGDFSILPSTDELAGRSPRIFVVARRSMTSVSYLVQCAYDTPDGRAFHAAAPMSLSGADVSMFLKALRGSAISATICWMFVVEEWDARSGATSVPFPPDVLSIPMNAMIVDDLLADKVTEGIGGTILAYAHAEWAGLINRAKGRLSIFDVYLGPIDRADTTSLMFLVLTETGSVMSSSCCLVSKIDFTSFRPQLDLAVADGRIEVVTAELGEAFHEVFSVLWSALETL